MCVSGSSAAQISHRYDRIARIYSPISVAFMFRTRMRDEAVRRLGLRPGASVLEVGSGTGANLGRLVEAVGPAGRIVGIDLSAEMLARADRLRLANDWKGVTLLRTDAEVFDSDERFEAILFSLSYSVLPEPRRTLERVWGQLSPGGTVVIMDSGLPESRFGRALRPFATALSRATVLGDPDTRPWDDLDRLGADVETTRFQGGTYFVCRGRKPTRASASSR